jgi:hypothetical protein
MNLLSDWTVSGVSAGCFMAVQTHFSFSSQITGAACIAGGPFYCAQDNIDIALTQCMTADAAPLINIDYLESIVRNTAATGFIDPVENLVGSRAWFYSAQNDTVVAPTVVEKNIQLYARFLDDPATQITAIMDHDGEHAAITAHWGNPCGTLGTPYINACGFDAAGAQLEYFYGPDLNKNATNGTLYSIDQSAYIPGGWGAWTGLAKEGFVYIPDNCKAGAPCHFHISFHGCEQSVADIGMDYVWNTGYVNRSDVVVLFPQALANDLNPRGCFDWWGYTGPTYASNKGIQVVTIYAIAQDLTRPNT